MTTAARMIRRVTARHMRAMSRLVENLAQELEDLIDEGDELIGRATGFGLRMALEMTMPEARAVVEAFEDNIKSLGDHTGRLERARKGAPPEDQADLDALIEKVEDRVKLLSRTHVKAVDALVAYEKKTTGRKLQNGAASLLGLMKQRWPTWKWFHVQEPVIEFVNKSGGYGRAKVKLQYDDRRGSKKWFLFTLAYKADTGEMWGGWKGEDSKWYEAFRSPSGSRWPLKGMLAKFEKQNPFYMGWCGLDSWPDPIKHLTPYANKYFPADLDWEIKHRKGGSTWPDVWDIYMEGEKVGYIAKSGYRGWGNVARYAIGDDRHDYDNYTMSQCPPNIDAREAVKRFKEYFQKLYSGTALAASALRRR